MQKQNPTWLDREEYPFTSRFVKRGNVQQHYIDEGSGPTLLFVHGTPSWSFDFRNIIKRMSSDYRCLAIDHVGFGLSDKPADYDYSLKNHIHNLETFIQQNELKDITLLLHDFGGPIGLEYALNHPENIKQIVILNSWIGTSENEPEFRKLSKILRGPLLPFLYLYLNFSPRFLLPKSFGDHKPDKKILSQYTKPFKNKSERYGPLAFAKSLLNDQTFFESQWERRGLLKDKSILLIWGMKDQFVGTKYLTRFIIGFSNTQKVELEGSGHFPQEEMPLEVTMGINCFLNQ